MKCPHCGESYRKGAQYSQHVEKCAEGDVEGPSDDELRKRLSRVESRLSQVEGKVAQESVKKDQYARDKASEALSRVDKVETVAQNAREKAEDAEANANETHPCANCDVGIGPPESGRVRECPACGCRLRFDESDIPDRPGEPA